MLKGNIMKNLDQLRLEIDELDSQLIELICQRQKLATQVGQFKAKHGIAPLAPTRWQQVLDARMALGLSLGLSPTLIRQIFDIIHEDSLSIQRNLQS